MVEEAIILAGGRGTRLRSVVADIPKPMADVNGRPFLAYLLDDLAAQGVRRCVLAVGYKQEVIVRHFGRRYGALELCYSVEDEPLGTGGAIALASKHADGRDLLVVNGDTFFSIDLKAFHAFFSSRRAALGMALKRMQSFDRYGTVKLARDGRIAGFEEKRSCAEGLINGGVYLLDAALLQRYSGPSSYSFEREILERMYKQEAFYGAEFDAYFVDIGVPEDYEKSKHDLAALQH